MQNGLHHRNQRIFVTYKITGQNCCSTFVVRSVNFRHSNHQQLYKIVVLKLWDYAQTIFRSEKLQISYLKPEIGTKITANCKNTQKNNRQL